MKYIEFGIGNTWLVWTETELPDGSEIEVRGIAGPVKCRSLYLILWIRRTVWVLDSQEGFKKTAKTKNRFKLIFGIRSEL
ncbi:DUF3977 family protein [Paenibacillus sp. MMS20-IR301]|uniref:DUF3977 family protein n=1 Tax=Paenibacillus sp. MMS20-IR301 TaxID=2895946 RepID=UPI0028E18701|nr:DUF3977 family protein [Paenibacillus sp. MMS20-IR301]WNS42726.1 DUF3977 family protein [Paenibacillus sp. MMS20-IR301]